MTKKTRLGVTFLAVFTFIASFGLDWFHIQAAGLASLGIGGGALTISAGDGTLSLAGITLDIWLIITIAIIGTGLGPFATGTSAPLPRFVPLIVLGVAAAYVGAGLLGALFGAPDTSNDPFGMTSASPGPGLFAAAMGIAVSVVAMLAPSNKMAT